ncbi:MAG: SRPBCC domain-containing protein [Defluviitaleaceae bacterium]|nr:SRPBCC domain-containing protein [Defluviitaleaceae bacterium]
MSAIKLEKVYPTTKDAVWAYLVKDELLSSWCMPTKGFALEPGEDFVFEMSASAFWDGVFYNTVTDFDEHKFLSYKCTAKKPRLETMVKWTLTEQEGKTKLTLEHSGFKGKDWLTKIMLKSGWKKMMDEHLYKKFT